MAVQYFFERGKKYQCNNNSQDWFENVRDLKPHIYFEDSEWHVVKSGHYTHYGKELCHERNGRAVNWMHVANGILKGATSNESAILKILARTLKVTENG